MVISMHDFNGPGWSKSPFLVTGSQGELIWLFLGDDGTLNVLRSIDYGKSWCEAFHGDPIWCQEFWVAANRKDISNEGFHLVSLTRSTLRWYAVPLDGSRLIPDLRQAVQVKGVISGALCLEAGRDNRSSKGDTLIVPLYSPSDCRWEVLRLGRDGHGAEVVGRNAGFAGRVRWSWMFLSDHGRYDVLFMTSGERGHEIWHQELMPPVTMKPIRVAEAVSDAVRPGFGLDTRGTLHLVWSSGSYGDAREHRPAGRSDLTVRYRRRAVGSWSRGEWSDEVVLTTLPGLPENGGVNRTPAVPVLIEEEDRLWLIWPSGDGFEAFSSLDRGSRWTRHDALRPEGVHSPEPIRVMTAERGRPYVFGLSLFQPSPFWVLATEDLKAVEGKEAEPTDRSPVTKRLSAIEREIASIAREVHGLESCRDGLQAQLARSAGRYSALERELGSLKARTETLTEQLQKALAERAFYESKAKQLERSLEAQNILVRRLRLAEEKGKATGCSGPVSFFVDGLKRLLGIGNNTHESQK